MLFLGKTLYLTVQPGKPGKLLLAFLKVIHKLVSVHIVLPAGVLHGRNPVLNIRLKLLAVVRTECKGSSFAADILQLRKKLLQTIEQTVRLRQHSPGGSKRIHRFSNHVQSAGCFIAVKQIVCSKQRSLNFRPAPDTVKLLFKTLALAIGEIQLGKLLNDIGELCCAKLPGLVLLLKLPKLP